MRLILDNGYLTLASRLIIGAVFIYASVYKIIDPGIFARSIWYYHLVPGVLINLMALILPWLELLTGLALVFGFLYRGAVVWVNIMMVVFIAALTATIVMGIDIDCGCFKASQSATEPAWNSLMLDIALLAFTLQLFFSRSKQWFLRVPA